MADDDGGVAPDERRGQGHPRGPRTTADNNHHRLDGDPGDRQPRPDPPPGGRSRGGRSRGGRSWDGPAPRDDGPGRPGGPWRGPPWAPPNPNHGPDWHGPRMRHHGPPAHVRRRFLRAFVGAGVGFLVVATGLLLAVVVVATRLVGDGPTAPTVAIAAGLVVVVLGLLVGGGLVLARRFATPLGDVLEGAERVRAGEAGVQVRPRGPGDVRRLATTFNQMASRIDSDERRRRALLADLAHELRTPLSVVRGTVEGMVDGVYEPTHERMDVVVDELGVMERLLDDLTTLSTAEAGALRLDREDIAVADVVGRTVRALDDRATRAGVAVTVDVADGLPVLDADPVRIEQVLVNLLTNAVRHTPVGGTVEVTAEAVDDAVRLAVADTGTGIDPADLEHVFDRFQRAADSGGSGLGLAIARSLVEAHGGDIAASPRPGGGTVVTLTLPRSGPT